MGNYIKRIYGDEGNPLVSSGGFVRPSENAQERIGQRLDRNYRNQFSFTATELCRLSKLPVTEPRLQLLRSRWKRPEDARNLERTLFQRLIHQLENEN